MTEYIAFLRGINVGGHNVPMERLRVLFTECGLDDVRSYIQTGNVFFTAHDGDRGALRQRIKTHLREALGYAVPTILRTVAELEAMLALDPFAGIDVTEDRRFAVTFFAEPHGLDLTLPYLTSKADYEVVCQTLTELFVVWHLVNGRTGTGYAALEKQSGVPGTTRFWHTTAKILAAAKKQTR